MRLDFSESISGAVLASERILTELCDDNLAELAKSYPVACYMMASTVGAEATFHINAAKYASRKEFRASDMYWYEKGRGAGWLDVAFPVVDEEIDFDDAYKRFCEAASVCRNKTELQATNRPMWRLGLENGWLGDAFKIDLDAMRSEFDAIKGGYSSVSQFKQSNYRLWRIASENGWLEGEFRSNPDDLEKLRAEFDAIKGGYSSVSHFKQSNYKLWRVASNNGWLEGEFQIDMDAVRAEFDEIKGSITSVSQFKHSNYRLWRIANANGWLDDDFHKAVNDNPLKKKPGRKKSYKDVNTPRRKAALDFYIMCRDKYGQDWAKWREEIIERGRDCMEDIVTANRLGWFAVDYEGFTMHKLVGDG